MITDMPYPCPFCGNVNMYLENDNAYCNKCEIKIPITIWNKRAEQSKIDINKGFIIAWTIMNHELEEYKKHDTLILKGEIYKKVSDSIEKMQHEN